MTWSWSRFVIDMAFLLGGVVVGYLCGSAVRARRDRARAGRQATIDRLIAPRGWDEHVEQALQPWREP
jgi:hypothetical protein